jgi:hypothetical protein
VVAKLQNASAKKNILCISLQTDFNKEENTLTIFYKIMSKVLLAQSTSSFQIYLFEHVIEP